jgi:integrase
MAIQRAPRKSDASGKCSRWRVILYNPTTHKQEWHTVDGTRREAEAFERAQKTRLGNGSYIARSERRTFGEIAGLFLAECEARGRRASTLRTYRSNVARHLRPEFGHREAGSIRKQDVSLFFTAKLKTGESAELVNRLIRTMKAVLNFALDKEMVERNVMARFRPYVGGSERRVNRGAFTEDEVRALLGAAKPQERALIGLLCFTGLRPGEAYALRWRDVDLRAGSLIVCRNWDYHAGVFTEPKTAAGSRVVALAGPLVAELEEHKTRSEGKPDDLVFANRGGRPMNPSNVRRDIWLPLRARAGVRALDLYSLRHTFTSLARASGEAAFNVSRALGHSKSALVDRVYAHTLPSGMASVAAAVAGRVLGEKPTLRVIEGGQQRDVRRSLDDSSDATEETRATG